jgi:Fic family protein
MDVPPRYRHGCSYEAFVPESVSGLEPALSGPVTGTVSDAEKAIAELNSTARPELLPLGRLLLRTESIASSKVEGLQVDARMLARAEAKRDFGRSIGPESTEILANIDAMVLAIERASEAGPIDENDLLDIHRRLLGGSRPRMAGRFRSVQNWIGGNDYNPCGADFVPPPPEEVPRMLADLCEFCNDETLPPLVQAAIAHAQFETIHPFEDGNGRTGRALVQVLLRRRGLSRSFVPPISVVLAQDKQRYLDGLTCFREDKVAEWVEMFATAAARAAVLAQIYLASVARLQDEWRKQLRDHSNPRSDAAAWDLIKVLPVHPIITIPVGVAATNRSRPAVSNGLAELQTAGVVMRTGTSARNLVWEANGVLDLVEELESGRWVPVSLSGYTDDDGRVWPYYSQSSLRVGSRAVVDLAVTDTIDVGDSLPTIVPGLSEVVVRKVRSDHGTFFNLVVRVPTEEASGDRSVVLANAHRRAGLPRSASGT